jgi:dual specificity MAP kinase phosphatase
MIPLPDRLSFDRITDHVWLGSRVASLDDYHRIRAQGVRACVDMKAEGPDPWGFEAFLWLPTDDHQAPAVPLLRMGLDFLRRCEEQERAVYVSCLAGIGRSPSLVLAHLIRSRFRGAPHEEALSFLCNKRPIVSLTDRQYAAAVSAATAEGTTEGPWPRSIPSAR